MLLLVLAVAAKAAPEPDATGLKRATSWTHSPTLPAPAAANAHFAIADFDGDAKPDLATVQVGKVTTSHTRYWIHFQLSGGGRQFIGLTAPVGGLELALKDVNGDQNLDLVVTTTWLKRPVAVLLNDGHGNFSLCDSVAFAGTVSDPEASCSAPTTAGTEAAAVFTRTGGDCEQVRTVLSVPRLSRPLRFALTHPSTSASRLSVLGRGPPCPVNHV